MAIILENTDINTAGVGITATTDTYVVEHNVHVSAQSQGFSTVQDGTELILGQDLDLGRLHLWR